MKFFLSADVLQAPDDLPGGEAFEIETLHARNGLRDLCSLVVAKMKITWAGGSSSVLGRALNAPLESMWTSSMTNTLYLADHRRVLRLFQKVADVIDAGVARRIDFDHVHRVTARDVLAARAFAARDERIAAGAVERAGEDARGGRLADAAGSRERKA